jgi:hypothetical protein
VEDWESERDKAAEQFSGLWEHNDCSDPVSEQRLPMAFVAGADWQRTRMNLIADLQADRIRSLMETLRGLMDAGMLSGAKGSIWTAALNFANRR